MSWGSFFGGVGGFALSLATGGAAAPLIGLGAGLGSAIEGSFEDDPAAPAPVTPERKASQALQLHRQGLVSPRGALGGAANAPQQMSQPIQFSPGLSDDERRKEQERKRLAALGMLGGGANYA